jgi:ABC-type branched-subunit amino acid transport system ATPase component
MADVKLSGVGKAYGDVKILKGIDLEIRDGEFMVFVGPSGCGKSTLLRTIAGLEDITEGTLSIGGRVVNDVPPADRGISAASAAMEQQMDQPATTAGQQLSGDALMGPGLITAATGSDHQRAGRGLNRPWQYTKIHGFSCRE